MKLKISRSFSQKLYDQVEYIARDKPEVARKFQKELLHRLAEIPSSPFKHRQSIYAEDRNIRDMIFKGYTVIYRIKEMADEKVFGLIKQQ